MKLWGNITTIEEIERILKKADNVRLDGKRGNHNGKIQGRNFKSTVFHRAYWVRLEGHMMGTQIKLSFDYRDKIGEVACKDDRIWIVVARIEGLAEQFCNLLPFYTDSQYYAHRHKHGELMRAVDKLLE